MKPNRQALEAGWQRVVGGESPRDVCKEIGCRPKDFYEFTRRKVIEIQARTDVEHKAVLIKRLESMLEAAWDKKADDPRWMMVCLAIVREEKDIVLSRTQPSYNAPKLGEVVDLDKVRKMQTDFEERKKRVQIGSAAAEE